MEILAYASILTNLVPAEAAHAALARKEAAEAKQAGKARELEAALWEASSLFKAEMAVKAAELDSLHTQLGWAMVPECR